MAFRVLSNLGMIKYDRRIVEEGVRTYDGIEVYYKVKDLRNVINIFDFDKI